MNFFAVSLKPVFMMRLGKISAISCTGTSPRKKYIGFSNELPPVNSIASSAPSLSSIFATSTHSSTWKPVFTPSSKLSFAISATLSGIDSLTLFAIVRAKRARFSREPPQSSFRLLSLGLKKLLIRYPCPKCSSIQSKPLSTASSAAETKSFMTRCICSSSAGVVFLNRVFEKIFDADNAGPPTPIPTGPA